MTTKKKNDTHFKSILNIWKKIDCKKVKMPTFISVDNLEFEKLANNWNEFNRRYPDMNIIMIRDKKHSDTTNMESVFWSHVKKGTPFTYYEIMKRFNCEFMLHFANNDDAKSIEVLNDIISFCNRVILTIRLMNWEEKATKKEMEKQSEKENMMKEKLSLIARHKKRNSNGHFLPDNTKNKSKEKKKK